MNEETNARLSKWMIQEYGEALDPIYDSVSEGQSESEIVGRMMDMRTLPIDIESIREELTVIVRQIIENERAEEPERPPTVVNNIYARKLYLDNSTYHNTITNSPGATLTVQKTAEAAPQPIEAPKPKRKRINKRRKGRQSINWLFIKDGQLTMQDRVLFCYFNRLETLEIRNPDNLRLRKYTGYRLSTIKASITKLQSLGYIDGELRVLKTGFKSLKVMRNSNDHKIIKAIVKRNREKGRTIRPTWAVKVFGISRRTYFRAMAA